MRFFQGVQKLCREWGLPIGGLPEAVGPEVNKIGAAVTTWELELKSAKGEGDSGYLRVLELLSRTFGAVGLDAKVVRNPMDRAHRRGEQRAALRIWFFPSGRKVVGRRALEDNAKSPSDKINLAIATDLLAWIHRGQYNEIHVCEGCGRVFTARHDARHCGRANCKDAILRRAGT